MFNALCEFTGLVEGILRRFKRKSTQSTHLMLEPYVKLRDTIPYGSPFLREKMQRIGIPQQRKDRNLNETLITFRYFQQVSLVRMQRVSLVRMPDCPGSQPLLLLLVFVLERFAFSCPLLRGCLRYCTHGF